MIAQERSQNPKKEEILCSSPGNLRKISRLIDPMALCKACTSNYLRNAQRQVEAMHKVATALVQGSDRFQSKLFADIYIALVCPLFIRSLRDLYHGRHDFAVDQLQQSCDLTTGNVLHRAQTA